MAFQGLALTIGTAHATRSVRSRDFELNRPASYSHWLSRCRSSGSVGRAWDRQQKELRNSFSWLEPGGCPSFMPCTRSERVLHPHRCMHHCAVFESLCLCTLDSVCSDVQFVAMLVVGQSTQRESVCVSAREGSFFLNTDEYINSRTQLDIS